MGHLRLGKVLGCPIGLGAHRGYLRALAVQIRLDSLRLLGKQGELRLVGFGIRLGPCKHRIGIAPLLFKARSLRFQGLPVFQGAFALGIGRLGFALQLRKALRELQAPRLNPAQVRFGFPGTRSRLLEGTLGLEI